MLKKAVCMLLVGLVFLGHLRGQQVIVARDDGSQPVVPASKKVTAPAQVASAQPPTLKQEYPKAQSVNQPVVKARPVIAKPSVGETPKPQSSPTLVMIARATPVSSPAGKASPAKIQPSAPAAVANVSPKPTKPAATLPSPPTAVANSSPKPAKPAAFQPSLPAAVANSSPKPAKGPTTLPDPRTMRLTKVEGPAPEPHSALPLNQPEPNTRTFKMPLETAFVKLADGFDFPVGKPEAQGYYKARGFRSHGHLGEDWDGIRGGDTDLGDPIYCIGDGVVVFARDCHMGWGNVIIVRHSYREGGMVKNVDSLYGHCDRILVHRGQVISRGQQLATMGTAHGLYDAHLHLEIRKNIEIGMSRAKFAQDSSNYYDPTEFINVHRHLPGGGASYRVAMNTFVQDSRINWSATRNFSHSHHRAGTRESSTALKKAVATTKD